MNPSPSFTEHRIATAGGEVYARDYPGHGDPFVLMHGFPDHLGIYDELVPHLVEAGRRVVTFDFLGFGRSEKRNGAAYGFAQQRDDLDAVVAALALDRLVPVAHDSSGPAAIHYALAHPDRVAGLCLLNSAWDDKLPTRWPELVTLFATPALAALALAVAGSPAQFGWLLGWQQGRFAEALPPVLRAHFETGMGPLIADNFVRQPGAGPAFVQMAAGFFPELARNSARAPELAGVHVPVRVIWGTFDPYITADVAKDLASRLPNASLHLLPGGHWIQSDLPAAVAAAMLS